MDETVYMVTPHALGGVPMQEDQFYTVDRDLALNLYAREIARPAAEVYMERLKAMGLTGVEISADAEPSVRVATRTLTLSCSVRK